MELKETKNNEEFEINKDKQLYDPSIPLTFSRVTRWYGDVAGVLNVSFSLSAGVTGLLGPNGAGKSTLIHIASGLIRPGLGNVYVYGENPFKSIRARARIGLLPETNAFPPKLTGRSFLIMCLNLSGVFGKEAKKRADFLLDLVGLEDKGRKKIESYSKGMKQRLKLAQAIGHKPDLLLLDEPLTALDPLARKQIIELVRSLGEEGKTVLVSSHILHEVEAMTDNIILLNQGRILAQGKISDIRARLFDQPLKVWIGLKKPRDAASQIVKLNSIKSIELSDNGIEVETVDMDGFYSYLNEACANGIFDVEEVRILDENLEAVFEYLVK